MSCKKCGSYAINEHNQGEDSDLTLCDVCFWQERCDDLKAELQLVREQTAKVARIMIEETKRERDEIKEVLQRERDDYKEQLRAK